MARWLRLLAFSMIGCAPGFGVAAESDLPANLHPWVVEHTADGRTADFFLVLREQADVSQARALTAKHDKGRFVFSSLTRTADASQAPVRTWLDAKGVRYRPYWIVNAILVEGGDRDLAVEAARRPEILRVEGNPVVRNALPEPGPVEEEGSKTSLAPEAVEWGISKVNAPAVWDLGFRGEGIVVGGQDTGYRWTHAALKSKYRGWNGSTAVHDYNWHDAIHTTGSSCGADSPVPCDDNGHGTHTMGTVLGDDGGSNQVGMAPGARWIGCRNMDSGYGTPATYLECFQFFLAPTRVDGSDPDPTKAPDVTNNSWGCPASEGCSWDTLQTAVDNQEAAGIMTVVSAGNNGSTCNTVGDPPALYLSSYTVGSTTSSDAMSYFSSRGYAAGTGAMKPNIVAPGSGIRSASYSSDTSYTILDGTSMAGPHVAGAVALLWSARPCLKNLQDDTAAVLDNSAFDLPGIVETCGGNYVTGPNNTWGNGRLDVLAAVQAGCPCVAPGVPAVGTAEVAGNNRIAVSWTAGAPAGTTYAVYRSTGACPGGTFTRVRSGLTSSPWVDDTVSGGTTYSYQVTAFDDTGGCESAPSACTSAIATGACTLPPVFAGLAAVTNAAQPTCAVQLSWGAATPSCSGPVRYEVYRSTSQPVAITPANLVASGLDAVSYLDDSGLANGAAYHYVVRAVDFSNGSKDANNVVRSVVPTGAVTVATSNDTFEGPGGFDLPGWSHAVLSGSLDWTWFAGLSHSPSHSWFAEDGESSGDKILVSPVIVAQGNTTVSFQHRYAFENGTTCYDGGTLEYAVAPSYAVWTVVPDAWFTANGFNGTVFSGSGNPISGKRAWCHSVSNWTPVSLHLGALAGQSLKLRWHEGDDGSVTGTGWYVDSVAIANGGTAATCSTDASCPAPLEVGDGVRAERSIHGTVLRWVAAPNALTSDVVRGALLSLPVGPGGGDEGCLANDLTVPRVEDPEAPPSGTGFWYVVRGGSACAGSGPLGYQGVRGSPGAARSTSSCP